jgi:hypothetical protein
MDHAKEGIRSTAGVVFEVGIGGLAHLGQAFGAMGEHFNGVSGGVV